MAENIDLASLFASVTQVLAQNQGTLNQMDAINQDHGTNMVQTFQTITKALQARQGKSPSSALAYAAKQLSTKATSGSGQLYAQGLSRAAAQFKGKPMDTRGAMQLLQTLIGGGQSTQSSGGLLDSLLGGMASGGEAQAQTPDQAGGDMLSSLLGGLMGGEKPSSSGSQGAGLDMGNLLNVGMSLLGGGQSGSSPLGSLVQAFTSSSGMGNSSHRDQSTALVVNTFLQALSALSKR